MPDPTPDRTAERDLDFVALHALRASCLGWGPVAVTTTADCEGQTPVPDVEDWCVYDPDEDDPPLAAGMCRTFADTVAHAINEAPLLVNRITRMEGERDAMRGALAVYREFFNAHQAVEQGVVNFDLHNTAVERLEQALRAVVAIQTEAVVEAIQADRSATS